MTRNTRLGRIVQILRTGYPETAPGHHYLPALALLRRRLSDDEVDTIAAALRTDVRHPIAGIDVRVAITKCLDALPSTEDTDRVTRRLRAAGHDVADKFRPRAE